MVSARWNPGVIRNYINRLQRCRNVPGVSLAVLKLSNDDSEFRELDFAAGYGTRDPTQRNAPSPDENTRFCIASITKSFTAGLAGKTVYENPNFKGEKYI